MRRHGTKPVVFALLLAVSLLSVAGPASAVSGGQTCKKAGLTATNKSGGKTVVFTCTKVRKKLLWVVMPTRPTTTVPVTTTTTTIPANVMSSCRLPDVLNQQDMGIGFPRRPLRLKSTGTIQVAVVFIDFSDYPSTRTVDDVYSTVFPESATRFSAESYGRADFKYNPIRQWLRMSRPAAEYGITRGQDFANHQRYVSEALALASSVSNLSTNDSFLIVANPDATPISYGPAFAPDNAFWGVSASGKLFLNGATSGNDILTWKSRWVNHELGHALGLLDLYAYTGATHRFAGEFGLMNNSYQRGSEYFAWERWLLGWLDDSQVVCVTSQELEITLTPIERVGGLKMAVIPLGPFRALVVEVRRAEGYDSNLPKGGILSYLIDTSVRIGEGPLKVLPINDADTRKIDALLGVGQSVSYEGVTISVKTSNSDGDTITVTR